MRLLVIFMWLSVFNLDLLAIQFSENSPKPPSIRWPFDLLCFDANGDQNIDLMLLDFVKPTKSILWLGDGQGGLKKIRQSGFIQGEAKGGYKLLATDIGNGVPNLFITSQTGGGEYKFLGAHGENNPETFTWSGKSIPGSQEMVMGDFNNDGNIDAIYGAPYNRISWGKGKQSLTLSTFTKGPKLDLGFRLVATDLDNDGFTDLLSSKGNHNRTSTIWIDLYKNKNGSGVFTECAIDSGLKACPGDGGHVIADFNNDGYLDIFSAGYSPVIRADEGDTKLYLNRKDGTFIDSTTDSGLNDKASFVTHYFQPTVADFDNDGLVDIVSFGHNKYHLYKNLGQAKFKEITSSAGVPSSYLAGLNKAQPSASAGDFNNDGKMDLAVISGPVWVGLNKTPTKNQWIKIKIKGPPGNPDGAGAKVSVYPAGQLGNSKKLLGYQEVLISSSFHTTGSLLHFGLGKHESVDVKVVFPGNKTIKLHKLSSASTHLASIKR